MLRAPPLRWLALLFVIIPIAALLWTAGTVTTTGGPLEGSRLWWPVLQVSSVMGSLGTVVLALSFLSPGLQAPTRQQYWGAIGESRYGEARSMQMVGKKIEGKITQARGRAQVEVGKATGKKSTELKGRVQQAKGKLTEKLG